MDDAKKESDVLTWRAWPLVQYPWRTALTAAVMAATGYGLYYLAQNVVLAAIGLVILAFSLHNHLLPRTFILDDDGVTVAVLGNKQKRDWGRFHSYYADRLGCMLSTFTYASRLDPFRGVNLRFGRDNRDAVIAFVSARLPRAEKRRGKIK